MNVFEIVKELEGTRGKKDKEALLKDHRDNMLLRECFRLAYSPTISFYIKQVPEYLNNGVSLELKEVIPMLYKLSSREITGTKAKEFVRDILESTTEEDRGIIIGILKGDLRCGVGVSTLNKVWKNLIVKCPRKGAASMNEKSLSKITFPAALELKSDGSFCASVCGSQVSMMSRNGFALEGLESLREVLSDPCLEGYALEGELVVDLTKATREAGNGIITKVVKGTATEEECDSIYYQVWDVIDASYFKPKGVWEESNTYRRGLLESKVGQLNSDKVVLIDRDIINSLVEAHSKFDEYVAQGFEGCILKQLDTPWKCIDKPTDCVKMKRQDPADLIVTGMEEGKGKCKGSMGKLLLESSDGLVKVSVGSGFSDEQRDDFWGNPRTGKVVEIKYDSITKDKRTGQHSLFLPIFLQERFDKNDADSYQDIVDKQQVNNS